MMMERQRRLPESNRATPVRKSAVLRPGSRGGYGGYGGGAASGPVAPSNARKRPPSSPHSSRRPSNAAARPGSRGGREAGGGGGGGDASSSRKVHLMFSEQLPICRPRFELLERDYADGGEQATARGRPGAVPPERPPSRAGSDSPSALQLDRRRPSTTAGRFASARWGQPSCAMALWPAAQGGDAAAPDPRRPSRRRPVTSAGGKTSARDFDRMATKHTLVTMSVLPALSSAE